MKLKRRDAFSSILVSTLVLAWGVLFLIPTEMQRIDSAILPVKWWSNLISLGVFGVFLLLFSFSLLRKKKFLKLKWQKGFLTNPFVWSSMLCVHISLNFLFRPSNLGLNFAINLLILAFGLTCILKSSKFFGIAHQIAIILVLVAALAYNWGYQLLNQSYSTRPDIGFAHSIALLSLALLPSLSRQPNPRFVFAVQGLLFACYFFLATTQLRLPTFIAAIFFALHGLWQTTSLSSKILATVANTFISFTVWNLVVKRSVFFGEGTLNLSGREEFYKTIASSQDSMLWLIIGNGPGAARAELLSVIGYNNPHSSLLVLISDYGLVGASIVSALVLASLYRVYCLGRRNKTGLRDFYASIALVISFGALSMFAEPVETTVVTLTALVAFFLIMVGLRTEQPVRD